MGFFFSYIKMGGGGIVKSFVFLFDHEFIFSLRGA